MHGIAQSLCESVQFVCDVVNMWNSFLCLYCESVSLWFPVHIPVEHAWNAEHILYMYMYMLYLSSQVLLGRPLLAPSLHLVLNFGNEY